MSSSNVNVNVTDDKVELSGTVASAGDKDKVEQVARANAGSRTIDDKIKVSSGSSANPQ